MNPCSGKAAVTFHRIIEGILIDNRQGVERVHCIEKRQHCETWQLKRRLGILWYRWVPFLGPVQYEH